jgi:hypothetical protein
MSKPSSTIALITWSVSFEDGVKMARLQEVHDKFINTTIDALAEDFNKFVKFREEIYASMSVNFQLDPTDQSCKVLRPFGFSDFAAAHL